MTLRALVVIAALCAACFGLGVLVGPAIFEDANAPEFGPGALPGTPDRRHDPEHKPRQSTNATRNTAALPERNPDPGNPAELERLRQQVRQQENEIRRLENQVARTDTGIVATQIARLAGMDVDELEMMLDDRRLIGSLDLLTSTAQKATIHNVWTALQLEADYLKHIERLEHGGPPVGAVASDEARRRFRDYRIRVIRPWIDNNLETLCTRFRNLGIPQPLIDNFRSRGLNDR